MNSKSRVVPFVLLAGAFVAGISLANLMEGSRVEAQQRVEAAGPGVPPVLQPDAKVFLQTPESIAGNAFTVREVAGPWVLVEHSDGGKRTYQRYWVYGPSMAWGVEGAFKPTGQ